mmetsp:Transcript_8204/g.18868  ORF Transcript_8204/g.18868 Transcript_8204/m.18868 type:complete len:240 (+) Transcript_8204:153-872(+)
MASRAFAPASRSTCLSTSFSGCSLPAATIDSSSGISVAAKPCEPIISISRPATRAIGKRGSSPCGRPTWTIRPPRRVHHTAFSEVFAKPAASTVTSAPNPAVTSATLARTYSSPCFASKACHAPSSRAFLQASSLVSTARTRTFSVAAMAIITADSPRPPQPNTARVSPAFRRPCCITARKAVVIRHPSAAACKKDTFGGRRLQLRSALGIATNSAKPPGKVKPGWAWASQMVGRLLEH